VILHVVRQSNQITIKRWQIDPDGQLIETDPPARLPAGEVVVLQPYGSLFYAAAPMFESGLPALTDASRHSVVILRLRGRTDLGTTFMDVLRRYAQGLAAIGSKLVIVSASEQTQEQLKVTGITGVIGTENVYAGDERVGATLKRAEALLWIETQQSAAGTDAQLANPSPRWWLSPALAPACPVASPTSPTRGCGQGPPRRPGCPGILLAALSNPGPVSCWDRGLCS
jgi:anti-anti-sigma regulatory factor